MQQGDSTGLMRFFNPLADLSSMNLAPLGHVFFRRMSQTMAHRAAVSLARVFLNHWNKREWVAFSSAGQCTRGSSNCTAVAFRYPKCRGG